MAKALTLESWDRMPPREQQAYSEQLAGELPSGFTFRAIRLYKLGGQEHHVAEFEFAGDSFVLVPGGEITLGYDADRPWQPTPEELESWQDTAETYEIGQTLLEYIARTTLRSRTVRLETLLIESTTQEIGWKPIPADDPTVRKIVREYLPETSAPYSLELCQGDSSTRVNRDHNGTIIAQRAVVLTHDDFARQLAREGFRLLTSDEWEYACGAGAPTLFRWGDHVPCDRNPTDVIPEEAVWRRRWVLSGGKLEYPPEGFTSDWDWHRRPNAFGIYIASNPYEYELVAEPDITRGGDGGGTICGGAGFFVGWLTLATAYFDEAICRRDPKEPITTGYTFARRVLPLA
jgi:hypothetical protein